MKSVLFAKIQLVLGVYLLFLALFRLRLMRIQLMPKKANKMIKLRYQAYLAYCLMVLQHLM